MIKLNISIQCVEESYYNTYLISILLYYAFRFISYYDGNIGYQYDLYN